MKKYRLYVLTVWLLLGLPAAAQYNQNHKAVNEKFTPTRKVRRDITTTMPDSSSSKVSGLKARNYLTKVWRNMVIFQLSMS